MLTAAVIAIIPLTLFSMLGLSFFIIIFRASPLGSFATLLLQGFVPLLTLLMHAVIIVVRVVTLDGAIFPIILLLYALWPRGCASDHCKVRQRYSIHEISVALAAFMRKNVILILALGLVCTCGYGWLEGHARIACLEYHKRMSGF